jgi:hypothetical protein
MDQANERKAYKGVVAVGTLVGTIIDPVTRRRGFATAELIAAWPEIVGGRWAECTAPEKIAWPRKEDGGLAMLTIKVDGPASIFVQHEAGQILERVNAFLGYGAVGKLRIVQGRVAGAGPRKKASNPTLPADREAELGARVEAVDEGPLRQALERLGRGVLSEKGR